MMSKNAIPSAGVLGSFAHLDSMLDAVKQAQNQEGVEVLDVFSPVPVEPLLKLLAPERSPVRYGTFFGALTGLVAGFALAIWTSLIWNMVVGGKPVAHHVPFVVVGFELTILLGAISTLLALLLFARLPHRTFPSAAYRPRFTEDRFGVWLGCKDEDCPRVQQLLEQAGAEEVHLVDPSSSGGGISAALVPEKEGGER